MNLNRSATNAQTTANVATLKQAADNLKNTAIEGTQELSETAAREASRIGEMARDWWQRHAQSAMNVAAGVKDNAVAAGQRTRGYVRDEPMKSLLIAAAAGALISGVLVIAARRDR
jgi:ElaB/YqjD/DUF883 family membrane-anchored ribosome-binding protein